MLAGLPENNTNGGLDDTETYFKLRVPKGCYHSVQQVGDVTSKQIGEAYGIYDAHLDMEMDETTGAPG
jgi:hypothetical protein